MSRITLMLVSTLLLSSLSVPALAGKWKNGNGATVEDAIRNAITKLRETNGIKSVDSRTRRFKTACKSNGPLYTVGMHGNFHSEGGYPNGDWISREAARLERGAKVCPITKPCRTSLKENIEAWHTGTTTANQALVAIEASCP